MKKYYPILVAKAGEIGALSQLLPDVQNATSPIIQVISESQARLINFGRDVWNFEGNELYLDFSLSSSDEASVELFIITLVEHGVNVVPVIQDVAVSRYLGLFDSLLSEGVINQVAVRFSNSRYFNEINPVNEELINRLSIAKENISIIIDFGYIHNDNYDSTESRMFEILPSIDSIDSYKNIIISSGSFPENLAYLEQTEEHHAPHILNRFEWNLWRAIRSNELYRPNLKYSDYMTKHPKHSEVRYAGSCSIKYSDEDSFIIYRGLKADGHVLSNGQYIEFSKKLVGTPYYSGEYFSWGDAKIWWHSQKLDYESPGNAKNWVEISQNHHITLINRLL